ncbi:MAG: hypothetical protein KKA64_04200 [Nanoarchaeota archaeon]|nr:hypothetical protein [Nanoarchaeota archaeon]
MNYKYISKGFLIKEYEAKRRSAISIAKELGCGETTIFRALEFCKIKRRTSKENQNPLFGKEPSKEELIEQHYPQHLSINKIAEKYDTSLGNMKRLFDKYKIRTKSHNEMIRPKDYIEPTREQLREWLYEKGLTTTQIGKILGVTSATIRNLFIKKGIPLKKTIKDKKPKGFWTKERVINNIKELNNSKINLSAKFMSDNYGKLFKGALKEFGTWGNAVNSAEIDYKKIKDKYYKYLCEDGHRVLSIPEMQVANWLYKNGIEYEYEPLISKMRKFKGDFKVGKFWIEVLGGWAYKEARGKEYKKRFDEKISTFQQKNKDGTVDCFGEEIEQYKPYFDNAPAILIKLIPKNNQLKEKQLTEQTGFLLTLDNKTNVKEKFSHL